MRVRIILTALVGLAALALATLGLVAPAPVLRLLTPPVRDLLTGPDLGPLVTGALVIYGVWVLLVRGRLSAIRTALPSDSREPADEPVEDAASPPATESAGTGRSQASISLLGRDIIRFGSKPDDESAGPDGSTAAQSSTVATDISSATTATDEAVASSGAGEVRDHDTETGGATPPTVESLPPLSFDRLQTSHPEQAQPGQASIVGTEFDHMAAKAVKQAGATHPYDVPTLRDRLRQLYLDQQQQYTDTELDDSTQQLDAGEWTDDPVARAFLSTDESVSPPLRERLWAWLTPTTTMQRIIDRSVTAVATHQPTEAEDD